MLPGRSLPERREPPHLARIRGLYAYNDGVVVGEETRAWRDQTRSVFFGARRPSLIRKNRNGAKCLGDSYERAARNPNRSLSDGLFTTIVRQPISARERSPPPPPNRRRGILLRSDFFGADSASVLRRRRISLVSPGSRLLANSDSVAIGMESPNPRQVRQFTPLRQGSNWCESLASLGRNDATA